MASNDSDMARVSQLGYLGFGVSDMGAWSEFATDIMGFQPNGTTARGSEFLRIDDYHHRFEICPTGEDDILWAGWEAKDAPTLARIANQVRALGVAVEQGSAAEAAERHVMDFIRFVDPNGLQVEVYWGPLLDHTPFVSSRGVAGFRAGDLGLGHIVMVVRDLAASIDFYERTLGVRISDYQSMSFGAMRIEICFTHVNQRHHSLALGAPVGGHPPPPPGAPPMKRLNHFMVEVNKLDDVGTALDIFQQRGMPAGQLGKHTNDWMISFYAPTPSGFQVEYGWNGRLIGSEQDWQVQHYRAPSLWGHGMAPASGQTRDAPEAA